MGIKKGELERRKNRERKAGEGDEVRKGKLEKETKWGRESWRRRRSEEGRAGEGEEVRKLELEMERK